MTMTYREWIARFENDSTEIGDIARMLRDDRSSFYAEDYESILLYLMRRRPTVGIVRAFLNSLINFVLDKQTARILSETVEFEKQKGRLPGPSSD